LIKKQLSRKNRKKLYTLFFTYQ